ncbi:MAG: GFA family protein [Desulfobulbaceae bacterium]|nr:GFA family protein [Desulfobulbaceae bacterium]
MTTHKGGCHCGRVRFEVAAQAEIEADQCNCSICRMTGYLHLIVPKEDFRLIAGEDDLETYTFNTGVAQHTFCRHCGIKSFYVPRSHPSGISVNVNCLEPETIQSITITPFDGSNWEKNVHKLSPLND